ncbi:retention module-containing protein, partial [Thiomicrorhabdus cannonii]|uniref:retention module-containing protein n=1 Tax=Thiomicrorhabdus cannonii TaxID=2748011 RepID=UPI0015BF7B5B
MSVEIGIISAASGVVQAVNPVTGEVRVLMVGDPVYLDEVLSTSINGSATVNMVNGELLSLGRDSEMLLDTNTLGIDPATLADSQAEVDALQQAILEGNLEDLEETAAGGDAGATSSLAGPLDLVERIGAEGAVTSGFETTTSGTTSIDRSYLEPELVENSPPVAVDDTLVTDEDLALQIPADSLLSNDTDIDGDTLVITGFTQPSHGVLVDNGDGSFTYTSEQNYNGPDSFSYSVTDGNGESDTALVSLIVNPINDNPVAIDDVSILDEDSSANIDVLANDSDLDGDTITVQSVTQPAHGNVVIEGDGTVTYTP